jgi:uncharacterized protein with von Willebrand factor type A (vWA) domain
VRDLGPDLADLSVALGRALARSGLPASPERTARFARAMNVAPPASRDDVYWSAKAIFVSSREQGVIFDRVFAALTGAPGAPDRNPNAPHHDDDYETRPAGPDSRALAPSLPGGQSTLLQSWSESRSADPDDDPASRDATLAAYSADERLGRRNFSELSGEELREVRRMMRDLSVAAPERRTRRRRRASHGRHLDLRRTLRGSLRTGGDPVRLARRTRRVRRRPLVLLLDVSGSMEPYARAFLQFLESAAGGARAETFAFSTQLTRVTRQLRYGSPATALDRAAAAASDWSGGTRLGEALEEFNRLYGRRGMARGAVVVILSDGWERGDPEPVGREMERLARLAHRIVWVNPRSAADAFEPLAGGMAAALPHCNVVLSGHSLDALHGVVEAIGGSG